MMMMMFILKIEGRGVQLALEKGVVQAAAGVYSSVCIGENGLSSCLGSFHLLFSIFLFPARERGTWAVNFQVAQGEKDEGGEKQNKSNPRHCNTRAWQKYRQKVVHHVSFSFSLLGDKERRTKKDESRCSI